MAKYLNSTGVQLLWNKVKNIVSKKAEAKSSIPVVYIDDTTMGNDWVDVTDNFKEVIKAVHKTDNYGDVTWNFEFVDNHQNDHFLVCLFKPDDYMLEDSFGELYNPHNDYEGYIVLVPLAMCLPGMNKATAIQSLGMFQIEITGDDVDYHVAIKQVLTAATAYKNFKTQLKS